MGFSEKPLLKSTAVPCICISNGDHTNLSKVGGNLERSNVRPKLSAFDILVAYIEHCLV